MKTLFKNGTIIDGSGAKPFVGDLLIEDDGTYADSAEVQAMPTYPNDGSIAVIDGKVIVKLGE